MSIYREMGDDDIRLLEHLYKELKLHGLDNRNDISNIVQQGEKLKKLDKELDEIAETIGRLNSLKMQLKNEVVELMEMISHCNSVMDEKGQETMDKI